jgi:hypothetical protein
MSQSDCDERHGTRVRGLCPREKPLTAKSAKNIRKER